MNKQSSITMSTVREGQLFICPNIGVLRKTGPITGQTKAGKVHVIYPNEQVALLKHEVTR